MSETVHVHYVIGDTVQDETLTADRVTFQHWPDGRAQIRLHNNGRITDWIAYRRADRIHRTHQEPA